MVLPKTFYLQESYMKKETIKSHGAIDCRKFQHYQSSQQISEAFGPNLDPVLLKVANALVQGGCVIAYEPEAGIMGVVLLFPDIGPDASVQVDIEVIKEDNAQTIRLNASVPSTLVKRLGAKFAEMVLKEAVYFTRDRSSIEEIGLEILPSGGDVCYSYEFCVDDRWSPVTNIETPVIQDENDQTALATAVSVRIELMRLFWHICYHQHLRDSGAIVTQKLRISEAEFMRDFGEFLDFMSDDAAAFVKSSGTLQ